VFSGWIVRNSISDRVNARLAVSALEDPISRCRDVTGYIVRSDRGPQSRSRKFVYALSRNHPIEYETIMNPPVSLAA